MNLLDIKNIPHPHWYKPLKENIDTPKVEVTKAHYAVSRGLNSFIDKVSDSDAEEKKLNKLPDWVKDYYPPSPTRNGKIWQLSRTQIAEALIYLHGKPFRLNRVNERGVVERRRYLYPIYNLRKSKTLLCCGRQVEKTSTICNLINTSSICTPFYRSIYLTPSIIQTSTFSSEKLTPVLRDSPLIRKYFIDSNCRSQAFDKSFTNGSYIFLRSAFYTADRARGISAHLFCADEIQDQISQNLEIVTECLSHAAYPRWLFTGTPKSLNNTMNGYWEKSTQTMWFVPCLRHGFADKRSSWYWQTLGIKNIGKESLICDKCGHPIDALIGEWRHTGDKDADWVGYNISQLMASWIPWKQTADAPDSILFKYENYDQATFYNEVLGLSFDSAEKVLTQKDIRQCCDESLNNSEANLEVIGNRGVHLFGGIDWGSRTIKSYTVFTVMIYEGQHLKVVYAKRYEGAESDYSFCLKDIQRIIEKYKITAVGADRGIGYAQNDLLSYALHGYISVPSNVRRLFPIQYVGNQHEYMVWKEEQQFYTLDRTKALNDMFQAIKHKKIIFPKWDSMYHPFFKDLLNIHAEIRTSETVGEKMMYSHSLDQTDDFAHALCFGRQIANRFFS